MKYIIVLLFLEIFLILTQKRENKRKLQIVIFRRIEPNLKKRINNRIKELLLIIMSDKKNMGCRFLRP